MNIKEVEELTGMARANIRFYESEGLLSPKREKNGYRDYSGADVEILGRIKLLRTLHMPLEDIKALNSGERELSDALGEHIERLRREQEDMEKSERVCGVMRSDGASYSTLDAGKYLRELERERETAVAELEADMMPRVCSPWRRFLARTLDASIYALLWSAALMLLLNSPGARTNAERIIDIIVTSVIMLFVEPALLAIFGTTPGKWILGLSVADEYGRKLSYGAALLRTFNVLIYGYGLNIPILNIVRLWKSRKTCEKGEELYWEYGNVLSLKDGKTWRNVVYAGTYAALFGVILLLAMLSTMPKHRGDITVAEFCDNFNYFLEFYDVHMGKTLGSDGKWVNEAGSYFISLYFEGSDSPEFIFTEENGVMTGLSFSLEVKNNDKWVSSAANVRQLAVLSFVWAQKGGGMVVGDIKPIMDHIANSPGDSFSYVRNGVTVTWDVQGNGYLCSSGVFFPTSPTDGEFINEISYTFEMKK